MASSKDQDVLHHYIYLLREREFVKSGEECYKIGRTSQEPAKRFKSYPKGSEIILYVEVDDSIAAEKQLLTLFKKEFLQRKNYGLEYFHGDKNKMIIAIITVATKSTENLEMLNNKIASLTTQIEKMQALNKQEQERYKVNQANHLPKKRRLSSSKTVLKIPEEDFDGEIISTLIRSNRPDLSINSVKTYVSRLKTLGNTLGIEISKESLSKNRKLILDSLVDMDVKQRSTFLSSCILVLGVGGGNNNTLQEFREAYMSKNIAISQIQSEKQSENWMSWEDVMKVQASLEKDVKPFLKLDTLTSAQVNKFSDYVIVSAYTLQPPRRALDYTEMLIKDPIDKTKDNWIDKNSFHFSNYKTKKYYGVQTVPINKKFLPYIKVWRKLNPTPYFIVDKSQNKMTSSKLSQRLAVLFNKMSFSVNMLRHIYNTDVGLSIDSTKKIAESIGQSIEPKENNQPDSLEVIKKTQDLIYINL